MKPPAEVLSSSKGPVDPKALIKWWLVEIEKCLESGPYDRSVVYDRTTFISDPIYRLVYGEPSGATTDEMLKGVQAIADHGCIVWCIPQWERTLASLTDEYRDNLEGLNVQRAQVVHWAYTVEMYKWKEIQPELGLHYDWRNKEAIIGEVEDYVT
jgi:hypothetical protein